MHELALCHALMRQLDEIVRQQEAARITKVVLRIGPLAGVEPELLRHAYPLASAGSAAAEAELIMQPMPIRVHCTQCGAESEAEINRLLCGECGGYHTQVISGDEMLLASVELEKGEPGNNGDVVLH